MTIGDKLHTTLASLRTAKASFEQFAMDTNDKMAKQMYFELANELDGAVKKLEGRVNYVEQQEPQYKVRQQAMQQNQPK